APGEVYSALERGAIDGYGWPSQGVLDLGWHEQTKYRVDPGFYQVDVNFLVNLDVWNGLTDEQRAVLEEGAQVIEATNTDNVATSADELRRQTEAGIQTIAFEGGVAADWLAAAQAEGWKAARGTAPSKSGDS
ncbi:MAG: ABC transporter substrate-binding protein, partial [Alphaproteobacteria bacterium HGW-Alphaproteobacteria-2]